MDNIDSMDVLYRTFVLEVDNSKSKYGKELKKASNIIFEEIPKKYGVSDSDLEDILAYFYDWAEWYSKIAFATGFDLAREIIEDCSKIRVMPEE